MKPFHLLILVALACAPALASAQPQVERNVVYGMYSGLALLMDVHHPEQPNGYGIIHVSGSGWRAPLSYDARPLKDAPHVQVEAVPLAAAGYTVFTMNHRATPRFPYPAALEDVQRAVRFIRHHAREYGIDPERIGAVSGSSGGHLVSLLGVLDGRGEAEDESPIDRESARVQAVVARAAPTDLIRPPEMLPAGMLVSAFWSDNPGSAEYRRYRAASPISHVSADDPPFLLVHGDADDVIPYEQSEWFAEALRGVGVEVELLRIPGGTHGPSFGDPERAQRYAREMVRWFDTHLRRE